ncbi:unnamed protein product [Dibothriocephalus latus]|uniref:Uncharacterized protein n=1 Tax=Dibothriocephalus latus TaxID=60516 RepID=A0A3P7LSL4_DIBLA|nr:unnamed protein product [Dibothriocephalus latus]
MSHACDCVRHVQLLQDLVSPKPPDRPGPMPRHLAITVSSVSSSLVRKSKLLGVRFGPLFTFANHAKEIAGKLIRCTVVLKALAGTPWGCDHIQSAGRASLWFPKISSFSLHRLETQRKRVELDVKRASTTPNRLNSNFYAGLKRQRPLHFTTDQTSLPTSQE